MNIVYACNDLSGKWKVECYLVIINLCTSAVKLAKNYDDTRVLALGLHWEGGESPSPRIFLLGVSVEVFIEVSYYN